MSIFKCKMCGGTLEINANQTTATCEYCGTVQTLPKLDDERRANLYDRANHFRRNNEFDKAMSIYENILNEDGTDAEAYWSLVLCRYGIEYVEDPATRKRVPTVNRAQFTSIFDDDNYKSALQHADGHQKAIYEQEANAINEIQKGILAISQKEEPFDVFICYKETDQNGRRTQDSVLANDLYHQLVAEGFKVFFSRITLEDKLGVAYEPYIFAALNSAKVMVVLGTKPEYFSAVWVKNEWSRYLALVKQSAGKKILIPAYKDMDPYDLPEEFSHLQAQDMSKLGFMQDLIRGIKKLAQSDAPKATVKETVVVNGGNANVAPLLKRAFMFLEDGDWDSANEYCEKVLDQDPENADAYLGKLMCDIKCRTRDKLKDMAEPFGGNANFNKCLRFGSPELAEELRGCISYIIERNENARLEGIYQNALGMYKSATSEAAYKKAAEHFSKIPTYKDAAEKAEECITKAEEARKEQIYEYSKKIFSGTIPDTEQNWKAAQRAFEFISGWKDSDDLALKCAEKAEECITKAEEARKEAIYSAALSKMGQSSDERGFASAASLFETIKDYKDSSEKIEECHRKSEECLKKAEKAAIEARYLAACANKKSMTVSNLETAVAQFEALNGYKDSADQVISCQSLISEIKAKEEAERAERERQAEIAQKRAKRNKKIAIITTLIICAVIGAVIAVVIILNTLIIPNIKYNDAVALMNEGKIVEAYEALIALDGYKDSAEKASSIYGEYIAEKLNTAEVGDYVFFGAYEQDNNTANGKEDIEWLVLDKKDGKVLVISKYALDCQQYNTSYTNVTWETCSLRKWLNGTFINEAFSEAEKAIIPTVTVSADKNPEYSTNPGNATQDKVFLLSITEANQYFSFDSARQCEATAYVEAQDAYVSSSNGNCWWWLRSPGLNQRYAASVYSDGDVGEGGPDVCYGTCAVRPALWIDIS